MIKTIVFLGVMKNGEIVGVVTLSHNSIFPLCTRLKQTNPLLANELSIISNNIFVHEIILPEFCCRQFFRLVVGKVKVFIVFFNNCQLFFNK